MISQGNLLDFKLDRLRLYSNTLQSIAAGYLIATIVLVELRNWRWQIGVTAGLLVLYWACMAFIPFQGHRADYSEQGNLGILLDKKILNGWTYGWIVGGAVVAGATIMIIAVGTWRTSRARLSQKIIAMSATALAVLWMIIAAVRVDRSFVVDFQDRTTYAWILASISFGATVMMGVLAGQLLKSSLDGWTKVGILAAGGLVCLALGWIWNLIPTPIGMPIIKHIWTSSMALWAGGWSLLLLALFYGVIDVLGWRAWSFVFIVIGANAILAYIANKLFNIGGIGRNLFGGLTKHFGSGADFGLAVLTFALMWAGMWFLYRKRVFLRV
jgi:predicted acyltransferase